jgi:hypothetical protein
LPPGPPLKVCKFQFLVPNHVCAKQHDVERDGFKCAGWQSQSQGHMYCKINVGIQNGEIDEITVLQGNEANMLGVKCK